LTSWVSSPAGLPQHNGRNDITHHFGITNGNPRCGTLIDFDGHGPAQ
jgi:hypothetical protein